MQARQRLTKKPSGLLRIAARLPIWLYRARLGWLLCGRFVMLTHIGRISGKPRQVVLEVVEYNPELAAITVASGWGKKSDWLQNILKTPQVEVTYGSRTRNACASVLSKDEAFLIIQRYATRHPFAFKELARFMIIDTPADQREACRAVSDTIPFVTLGLKNDPELEENGV
ncbi:MAG: nitroreductase family deazaflavin-dependent oxidoreductase [Anaerolineales bacterium]|nr:nitroreductase family deazaflavin-dependent oxidoreductase [Anaerolineales bacterium]